MAPDPLRLSVITGRRPNHVSPLIKRLKKLAPEQADTYKYAAIFHVNGFFQYKTALADIETYRKLRPRDPFGHSVAGFLNFRLRQYQWALTALDRAIELQPDNVYALALKARCYALMSEQSKISARRHYYRTQALSMLAAAKSAPTPDPGRITRLKRWLDARLG